MNQWRLSSGHVFKKKFTGSGRFGQLGTLRRVNIERIRVLMESGDDMGVEALGETFTYYHSCLQGDSMEVAVQTFYQLLEGLGKPVT